MGLEGNSMISSLRNAFNSKIFGGKAFGLSKLIISGMNVPEGFAVEATTTNPIDWSGDLQSEYTQYCLKLLKNGPISVRSSAIVEDSREKSYAGIFRTILNIETIQNAVEAAGVCIASGQSDRARNYHNASWPIPVGIVVQQMVMAKSSGVIFTKSPIGDNLLIEAVLGLGEKLVSGEVQPQQYEISHNSGKIYGSKVEVGDDESIILNCNITDKLATLALKLSLKWGEELDLEWAIGQDDVIYWLQARPITTLTSNV